MTTTILAAVALAGSLMSAKPEFQAGTDYSKAVKQAAAEGKPIAVMIGHGDGFAKVMADSKLPPTTAKLLRDKFVCLTVNVDTPTGAQLASQFELTDGLVISSAGGAHQALRQAGTVSVTDLTKHVTNYSTVSRTLATTVSVGEAPVVSSTPYTVYPAGYTPTYPGTVIQSGYTYPSRSYSYPATGSYTLPSGSSCPNGRCPNQR